MRNLDLINASHVSLHMQANIHAYNIMEWAHLRGSHHLSTYPPPHLLGVEGKVCIVWGYDFSGEATQNHINMMFKRQLRRHSVYGLQRTRFAKPKCNYANQINIDKLLSNIIFLPNINKCYIKGKYKHQRGCRTGLPLTCMPLDTYVNIRIMATPHLSQGPERKR